MVNYYNVLGVGRNAKEFDIQDSYRRLALKWHPQKHDHSKESEVKFREIAEAYTVLSDGVKRSRFDQWGEDGLKNGVLENTEYRGWQYTGNPFQLFFKFFGEHSPFGLEQTQKFGLKKRVLGVQEHEESVVELRVTLEEIFMGKQRTEKVQRQRFDSENKMYIEDKILTIAIEKTWKAGMKLRFPGEGDQVHPREKCTDLVFVIVEEPHKDFERIADSSDILYVHSVSLKDALCGHVLSVTQLDGKDLSLHIAEGVTPGYEKRILGHGFKKSATASGDLVIRWDISFPELSSEQKASLRTIL